MKIQNLISRRSGRAVANQFVAYDNVLTFFQSYKSIIAIIDGAHREIVIGRDWDYSVTTAKYFYQFMREYAPVVDFDWCKNSITNILHIGTFTDKVGNLWLVRYDSTLA